MSKRILQGEEARQALLAGVNIMADVVGSTIGPRGRTVVIKRQYGNPISTKDGVSVAREIDIKDPIESVGAQMIREVATRTVDACGDGTSTATILARSIFAEGVKLIAAGADPAALKRGIDAAVLAIIGTRNETSNKYEGGALQSISIPVSGDMIAQVGTISANGDTEIGKLIATAMEKVGTDGIITVDNSNTIETTLTVVDGMQFDRGFINPNFINDFEHRLVDLTAPDGKYVYILMVDRKMSTFIDMTPFLEAIKIDVRPFLIIADDVEGEVIQAMVINKLKGVVQSCAVKSPGFGDRRKHILHDIAVLTGGTVISDDTGTTLQTVKLEHLGKAKRIVIDKDSTTIIDGMGHPLKIEARAADIRAAVEAATTDYDREKLRERLAKLASGVAIIKVGAVTAVELSERKDRVDDALHATQAAVEEGIVPGGGTALIRCANWVQNVANALSGDERFGANIILKALEVPLRQIAENAAVDAGVVVRDVYATKDPNGGYNVVTGQVENLVDSGVIDPCKVVRVALQNAASVSSLMLTTASILVEMPEPPTPQPAPVAFQ